MKFWKNTKKDEKAAPKTETLAEKTISDDLMAQITGGAGKDACH